MHYGATFVCMATLTPLGLQPSVALSFSLSLFFSHTLSLSYSLLLSLCHWLPVILSIPFTLSPFSLYIRLILPLFFPLRLFLSLSASWGDEHTVAYRGTRSQTQSPSTSQGKAESPGVEREETLEERGKRGAEGMEERKIYIQFDEKII